jgi:hypothetical protein
MANQHVGGNFDDFLAEEGMLEEVTATAMKRVVDWQNRARITARASRSTLQQPKHNPHLIAEEYALRGRTSDQQ